MRIYLDHNATTPLRDEVVDAMVDVLRHVAGNPSSTHAEGAEARRRVEEARARVASLLGGSSEEILFTGGATESNNTVLAGLLDRQPIAHVVTTRIEHPSVYEPLRRRAEAGTPLTELPVDSDGLLEPGAVADAIRPETRLVSIIWANNETGVIQPIDAITEIAHERGVPVHVDATQAVGKHPIDLFRTPVDFLSCSAHKLGGPKGTGALFVRSGRSLPPLLEGGPQEKRRRGGTENVAGIVGFGAACALAEAELDERIERYAGLRDRLWEGLSREIPELRWNAPRDAVLCNTLNVEFPGVPGDVLTEALDLDGIAVSMGAACHSGSVTPSHVLAAMGRTPEQARASLRLSVGHGIDEAQIDRVVKELAVRVPKLRGRASS